MSPREPKPGEPLNFDDREDTGEREKYRPRRLFRKKGVPEDEKMQDGILDNLMSGLPGDTITTSRDEIRKLTKE